MNLSYDIENKKIIPWSLMNDLPATSGTIKPGLSDFAGYR